MLSTVVCFAFIAAVSATIVPPIPTLSEDQGIRYPLNATSRGKVKIEAFIELLCPDSRAAYPVLKRVAEHYGEENVELVFHQMTLPYHRNAFIATQVGVNHYELFGVYQLHKIIEYYLSVSQYLYFKFNPMLILAF